jgi:acyl carrier protein
MEILALLKETLHERYDVPLEAITPESHLDTLGIDSLGLVELMFELEDRLGVRLPEDFATPTTVSDVIAVVERFLQSQPALAT